MTSKCGKNKKVAHEAKPSVSLMLESMNIKSICLFYLFGFYLFYIVIKKQTTTDKAFFSFRKPAFAHFAHAKKSHLT